MNSNEMFRHQRETQMGEQVRNHLLPMPAQPCNASHMTFGGKCLNCGGVNGHAVQPKR